MDPEKILEKDMEKAIYSTYWQKAKGITYHSVTFLHGFASLHIISTLVFWLGRKETSLNSRQKGARGERELANRLKDYGYNTRRGQQYSGLEGQDVVGLDGVHIECKRVERLNIYNAIDQAKRDAGDGSKPTVFHRKNHCEWLVTMTLDDWIELYREWSNG